MIFFIKILETILNFLYAEHADTVVPWYNQGNASRVPMPPPLLWIPNSKDARAPYIKLHSICKEPNDILLYTLNRL